MVNLYDYKIYFKDKLINNVFSIDVDFRQSSTPDVSFIRIRFVDENFKIAEIVGVYEDFSFRD